MLNGHCIIVVTINGHKSPYDDRSTLRSDGQYLIVKQPDYEEERMIPLKLVHRIYHD